MANAINDTNFKAEVLDVAEVPVMVDFWAQWCTPCKMLSPILDEVAEQYKGKVKYVKVETDESPEAPAKYGIMSIPTIIIFKNGQEVFRSVGVQPKASFEKALNEVV